MTVIHELGRYVIAQVQGIGAAVLLILRAITGLPGLAALHRFIYQMYRSGVQSILIIVVSGLFIGLVLGLLGFTILTRYGSQQMLGVLVSLALVRELGPVVTALLFAGRAGSALTAEIGLMKATEQLASMEMIGVDPVRHVVAPRFWAAWLSLPLLSLIFTAVGILGGKLVGVDWLGVDEGSFWGTMQNSVDFTQDVVNGLIKSVVFGLVCAVIAVYQGYGCTPTSAGIASATTRTVVLSSLTVLGLDFVLTAVMFGGLS